MRPEYVGVGSFANFAFEFLPETGRNIFSVLSHLLLSRDPVLEAEVVNEPHRPLALARNDERVVRSFLVTPAEATVFVFGLSIAINKPELN